MSPLRRSCVWIPLPVCLALLTAAAVIVSEAAPPKPTPAKEIAGWGTWVDPDGDCEVRADKGGVTITVPAAVHDLWPENPDAKQRADAPRLVQDVDGDFSAEVKVTGHVLGGEFFRSGAMVIWQDENNFVRFERAGSFREKTPRHYCWLHVFKDGKRIVNLQKEPIGDVETVLRLTRKGDRFDAGFSQDDGKTFTTFPQQDLPLAAKTKVGVAALNASKAPFTLRLERFKLTPAAGAGAAAVE